MQAAPPLRNPTVTREKLVGAALRLMLKQGFHATTVDQICGEAGLTKGSFFHYFESKEDLGLAALDSFARMGFEAYAEAWQPEGQDPLETIHRLFDIMTGFARGASGPCVCMVGMMSQEMSATNPSMRKACEGHLDVWSGMMRRLLAEAKKCHRPAVPFDPERVAWFLNSLWQGSMLIAKTRQNPKMIADNLRLARAYVDGLFAGPGSRTRN